MPSLYRNGFRKSIRHPSTFAHDAVYAEFRPRDARAIDYDDFEDRQPHERPPRIHEIGAQ
jgi:hypothetical protein